MKKVLIAYSSRTGTTQKMADYLAEGFRMSDNQVEAVKISTLKDEKDISGYDAYLFGCPTYHKDMTGGMKQFLFKAERANLIGKIAGAFGSHTHSGEAAPMVFDTMQHVFKMDVTTLGPLNLTEEIMSNDEGVKACHDYAKAIAEKL
ncbi:flavodoxin domain-containing protein [Desulfobacula toluolica]|uniref:Flavodoxin family protein n=1 Tax=Desulfobacula toluolica (strain DSM 7467 / Tol2) TaxID=651182 RepID=K0NC66_DESTT|nr:flavodoxin domain-containing protein [Desulfobacula toluolica]CCK78210.1 flavodoxin family protein [Desulfobacula toluolica Tol2]